MGTITAINRQRRPGRYNIVVDGDFAIAVAEKVIVDLRLAVGQELDETKLAEVSQKEDANKALNNALLLLESRERSEHEIRNRLEDKGYDLTIIDQTISVLSGLGFLNDRQFTATWINSRSRSQPAGVHKLRSELTLKGVAKETIDNAIGEISDEDQIELARKAISKRKIPETTTFEERQAAYAKDSSYLARRGFGWSITKIVMKARYGRAADSDDG